MSNRRLLFYRHGADNSPGSRRGSTTFERDCFVPWRIRGKSAPLSLGETRQSCTRPRARPATWVARVSRPSLPAEDLPTIRSHILGGTSTSSTLPFDTFRLTSSLFDREISNGTAGFETLREAPGVTPSVTCWRFTYVSTCSGIDHARSRTNATSHAWRTKLRELGSCTSRFQTRCYRKDAKKRVRGSQERSRRHRHGGAPGEWK